jgi:hypothetical protein
MVGHEDIATEQKTQSSPGFIHGRHNQRELVIGDLRLRAQKIFRRKEDSIGGDEALNV